MSHSQQPLPRPETLDHPGARSNTPSGGRPVGAALIALMFLFYIVVTVYNAVDAFQGMNATGISAAARSDARWAFGFALVQLPFYAAAAFGVWRLKRWGWYLALVFLAINIVRFVVEAFFFPSLAIGLLAALSRSVIPLTIMLYLLHPSIRPIFRTDGTTAR